MIRKAFFKLFFISSLFYCQFASADKVEVTWKHSIPKIESSRIFLRPIKEKDLGFYINLFENSIAMNQFMNGPRDKKYTEKRFKTWKQRWKIHPFSALAIVEKKHKKVIGHVVLGHGDFEGAENIHQGWSEVAYIILPQYWNSDYQDKDKEIGTMGYKGLGTEVVEAVMVYAKTLSEKGFLVPSDVVEEQRDEVEKLVETGQIKKYIRDDQGNIQVVFLPFTHIRATCSRENLGSYNILEKVFIKEYRGAKTPYSEIRDLFEVSLR